MTSKREPLVFEGAYVHRLHSTEIGQDYRIMVAPPPDPSPGKLYPVVYVLDANAIFATVLDTYRLRISGEMPTMIIVGIGYEDIATQMRFRNRDLTPIHDPSYPPTMAGPGEPVVGGGADAFLRFIRNEVRPFVEAEYPADPEDGSIFGHSHGGLFVMHSLFREPGLFQRYLAGSPSLWWADHFVGKSERLHASTSTDLTARLFMSAGELEPRIVNEMTGMADELRSRGYASLELKTVVFEGETHQSVVPPTMARGLRYLYRL